ncbi:hypothetical protein AMJ49_06600 [Parcubacteria bacterium DG_74_2]|nr:MAG: hypothetical protein AMJ49_06600 [Parcubacteria bacterium DG_74_2]
MAYIEALGICEHCGALVSLENLPAEALDAIWKCTKCEKELTSKSFGFEKIKGEFKKTKWVGPGKKWTFVRSTKNFNIGNLLVSVTSPITPLF